VTDYEKDLWFFERSSFSCAQAYRDASLIALIYCYYIVSFIMDNLPLFDPSQAASFLSELPFGLNLPPLATQSQKAPTAQGTAQVQVFSIPLLQPVGRAKPTLSRSASFNAGQVGIERGLPLPAGQQQALPGRQANQTQQQAALQSQPQLIP
jgi:hypothetical protein